MASLHPSAGGLYRLSFRYGGKQFLRSLGPSMILSASIVGSGELIMTTTLDAQSDRSGRGLVLRYFDDRLFTLHERADAKY